MRGLLLFLLPLSLFSEVLTVNISDIDLSKGEKLYIAVSDKDDKFPNGKFKQTVLTPKNSKESVKFDLPKGEYAVSLFHDKNNNKIIDKNILGIPKERYGVSGNYAMFPSFEESKIILEYEITIEIKLNY